jgi:hypothetical protein
MSLGRYVFEHPNPNPPTNSWSLELIIIIKVDRLDKEV